MGRLLQRIAGAGTIALILTTATLATASIARAQGAPDPVSIQAVDAGHGKIRLTVTAGPSGAPDGFEVCWMEASLFNSYGNVWPPPWVRGEGWDNYVGVGTLNTWGQSSVNFKLAPNQTLDIEVGDTYDETGVTGTRMSELTDGASYALCAYAIGSAGGPGSALSVTLSQSTTIQGSNCTFTQGYWKTHASAWPVLSLTLGTVTYTQSQLLSIFNAPVVGNGLIALAHQLIAAKLNIAAGADPSPVVAAITAADAQIGGLVVPPVGSGSLTTASTSAKSQSLDDFNNGVIGPGHCGTTPTHVSTWGSLKTLYR